MVSGGILLLLVPAAESAVMVQRRHIQWLVYRRQNGYTVCTPVDPFLRWRVADGGCVVNAGAAKREERGS